MGANTSSTSVSFGGSRCTSEGGAWWSITLKGVDPVKKPFRVLFHRNKAVKGNTQSEEILINDTAHVYLTLNAEQKFTTKEAAQSVSSLPKGHMKTRVWFYDTNAWGYGLYAYVYGADINNDKTGNGEALGSWPGGKMTREGTSNWYYIDVPASPSFNVICVDNDSTDILTDRIETQIGNSVQVNLAFDKNGAAHKYAKKSLAEANAAVPMPLPEPETEEQVDLSKKDPKLENYVPSDTASETKKETYEITHGPKQIVKTNPKAMILPLITGGVAIVLSIPLIWIVLKAKKK